MSRISTSLVLFCAAAFLKPLPASAVAISTVPVGNPGNAADQDYGAGQFGAVTYNYRIGTYEVTNSQYVEFLNTKDPTGANTLGLYISSMTSDGKGGIDFTAGNTDGAKYSIKSGRGSNPVLFVGFYDSLRFINWLHNDQGPLGDTETGSYTLLGGTPTPSNGSTISRNANATWVLPSEHEWYKAAYHQPALDGGDPDNYWLYPTGTNNTPYSDQPPGSGAPNQANTGNFYDTDGTPNGYNDGFAATASTTFVPSANYLTDVGAYTQSESYYATFDQGGNVWEWNESLFAFGRRGLRGGGWGRGTPFGPTSIGASISITEYEHTTAGGSDVGFRVARVTIPEPGTLALVALGVCGLFCRRRRAGC